MTAAGTYGEIRPGWLFGWCDSNLSFLEIVEWVLRFFPPFCLGKALLFIMNMQAWLDIQGQSVNAFDLDVAGYEVSRTVDGKLLSVTPGSSLCFGCLGPVDIFVC